MGACLIKQRQRFKQTQIPQLVGSIENSATSSVAAGSFAYDFTGFKVVCLMCRTDGGYSSTSYHTINFGTSTGSINFTGNSGRTESGTLVTFYRTFTLSNDGMSGGAGNNQGGGPYNVAQIPQHCGVLYDMDWGYPN